MRVHGKQESNIVRYKPQEDTLRLVEKSIERMVAMATALLLLHFVHPLHTLYSDILSHRIPFNKVALSTFTPGSLLFPLSTTNNEFMLVGPTLCFFMIHPPMRGR